MSSHRNKTNQQFNPQAQAYLASSVHAEGADLQYAQALVARTLPTSAQAVDIGCGAGHLSFTLAPHLARMVALDPAQQMLDTVATSAAERALPQIETCQAPAEALPFPDQSFCMAATRYSAHHWTQLEAALKEMHRVIRPNGYLLMIDVIGDANPLVDTHLQAMELLRDPSHVRNRSQAEWRALLSVSGFELAEYCDWPVRLEFASWVARMRTSAPRVAQIRELQRDAPLEVKQGLAIEDDGSFTIRTGLFWAKRV